MSSSYPRERERRLREKEEKAKLQKPCKARMRDGLRCEWHAIDGKQLCWVHQTMLEMPANPGDAERMQGYLNT